METLTMRDIEAIPWNGFKVISFFAGCGGSCLGYRMAGFRVLWANEYDHEAARTYRRNHPKVWVDERSIRDIKPTEILRAIRMQPGELDVLDGSPPCTVFSTVGQREKAWSREDRTQDYFFDYGEIVRAVQPKVFIAENVTGLAKGAAREYLTAILAHLRGCGYVVECRELDASLLGVAQQRKRLIFLGVRKDLKAFPAWPVMDQRHKAMKEAAPQVIENYSRQKRLDVPGRVMQKRLPRRANRPAFTVCSSALPLKTGHGFAAVWVQGMDGRERPWTIPELKAISGFPPDFILTGSFEDQWRRLGNCVAPPMMKRVAETVRDQILAVA